MNAGCQSPPPLTDSELRMYLAADPDCPPDGYARLDTHLRECEECGGRLAALQDRAAARAKARLDSPPELAPSAPVGEYTVVRTVDKSGGQGVVYQVSDKALGRDVALKLSTAAIDPDSIEQFRAGARAHAGLTHPHITPLHSFGIHEGRPFFVMELAETSLHNALHDPLHAPLAPGSDAAAAELVEQLASAVEYAHGKGSYHRDLKAKNILLTFAGAADAPRDVTAKLTDFGLVGAGDLAGSPNHLAPEVAAAIVKRASPAPQKPTTPVSRTAVTEAYDGFAPHDYVRIDVYGLGAILHEVLTRQPPYLGKGRAEIIRAVADPKGMPGLAGPCAPSRVGRIPPTLRAIALKCLARDPSARYPNAAAVADDLRRFREREPTTAYPKGWAARLAWRGGLWCRRRPAQAALLGSLFAGVLVLAAAGNWFLDGRANRHAVTILNREPDAPLRPAVDDLRSDPYPLVTTFTARRLGAELGHDPGTSPAAVRRRASAAAGLALLGRTADIWPRLRYGADPGLRYHLIRALATAGVPPDDIARELVPLLSSPTDEDAGIRQALVLYFGLYDARKDPTEAERLVPSPPPVSADLRAAVGRCLEEAYRTDPDPGVHSACEWTLRRWDVPLGPLDDAIGAERSEARFLERRGRGDSSWRWYVAANGHTMVVVEPPGAPHAYAISTKEVTFGQIERVERKERIGAHGRAPTRPVNGVTLPSAYDYCARLGTPPAASGRPFFASAARIVPGVEPRALAGYRPPDEGESITACRGGTGARWFFGDDPDLMGWFAWTNGNAAKGFPVPDGTAGAPVGLLMPNPWGLFDCLGNVAEICLRSPSGAGAFPITVRGGCYQNPAGGVGADVILPAAGGRVVGFRVARTLDPPG